ncbi:MAG: hypothetical protein ACI8W3_000361 [Myxococcota bacterium]|jgi:hypothetical protein
MVKLRKQLVTRLEKLGVEGRALPDRADPFSSLLYEGKGFAHFHNDTELDVRLTEAVVNREGLVCITDSDVHPTRAAGSRWFEVRLTKAVELPEAVGLVKLAIAQF